MFINQQLVTLKIMLLGRRFKVCKLIMMAGITDETRANALAFIGEVHKNMSAFDKDGFGYAAMSSEGKLFGERWLYNSEAFETRESLTPRDRKLINDYCGMIYKSEKYGAFGDVELDKMTAITLHARMATSGKAFYNTHPFVDGHTSVVHNGVLSVNNPKHDYKNSTCDSEQILIKYLKNSVGETPTNIKQVTNKLDGYFACGVFSRDADEQPILDIFKDERANLNALFITELNTVVFATSYEHVVKACETLNFTVETIFSVAPGIMVRLNAITGDVIDAFDFELDKPVKSYYNSGRADGYPNYSGYGKKTPATLVHSPTKGWVEKDAEEKEKEEEEYRKAFSNMAFNQGDE